MSVRVRAYAAAAVAALLAPGLAAAQSAQPAPRRKLSCASGTSGPRGRAGRASRGRRHHAEPSRKARQAQEGPQGAGAAAPAADEAPPATAAPKPELVPLPGSIVSAEGVFVPVTVTTQRELVGQGGATITETLQLKPGISGTSFAPGANRPIIRGLDSYRVRTQENGIGTHDVAAISEDHAIPVDPLAADRVEVVRGPATLRYGSQAIGGVVSVENERIPTFIPPGGFSGKVIGGYSSVDDGADGAISATAGAGGVAVHADGFKRSAEDYSSPRGTVRNSFVESEGASIGASLIGSDGFIGLAYTRFESLYGVPGEEADEGVDPQIDMVQDKVTAKGEWRGGSNGIEASALLVRRLRLRARRACQARARCER